MSVQTNYDVIIIGGGQSALACGYYLRRTDLKYIILDNQEQCGGSWNKSWDSLTLFSPSEQSSLPGWLMPKSKGEFPTRDEVISYICQYEKRYKLPVKRPVKISSITKEKGVFKLKSDRGNLFCNFLISATGSWSKPYIPNLPGKNLFEGRQVHSAFYTNADDFHDQKTLIVGEGNSGAQIIAEVSKHTSTTWATMGPPKFLPDDVDGRVLFDQATAKYYAEKKGEKLDLSKYNLGSIVMLPTVKEARQRNVLRSKGKIKSLHKNGVIWSSGETENFDAIIWCTGFQAATDHLSQLVNIDSKGKIKTEGTRSVEEKNLWLVGYGGWTGFASATLIGVGRIARSTVKEIVNEKLKS